MSSLNSSIALLHKLYMDHRNVRQNRVNLQKTLNFTYVCDIIRYVCMCVCVREHPRACAAVRGFVKSISVFNYTETLIDTDGVYSVPKFWGVNHTKWACLKGSTPYIYRWNHWTVSVLYIYTLYMYSTFWTNWTQSFILSKI